MYRLIRQCNELQKELVDLPILEVFNEISSLTTDGKHRNQVPSSLNDKHKETTCSKRSMKTNVRTSSSSKWIYYTLNCT